MDEDDVRQMFAEVNEELARDQEAGGELQVMVRHVLAKLEVIDQRLRALERRLPG